MSRLVIYPSCLECPFRKLDCFSVWGNRDTKKVEQCVHEPVCKFIEREKPITRKVVE